MQELRRRLRAAVQILLFGRMTDWEDEMFRAAQRGYARAQQAGGE